MSRKLTAAGLVGLEELAEPVKLQSTASNDGVTRVTPDMEQLVVSLPLTSIAPNPRQPRQAFATETLQDLATSIAEHGRVLQPIVVRPSGAGDGPAFELVTGERRWRASQLAGLPTVRAIVDGVDDSRSAEMALTENMARDDLTPVEEARGCAALRDDFGLSVTQIGQRVGRDRSAISHLLRLLDLPGPVLELIGNGSLSEGHGRVLLRLPAADAQFDVARACAQAQWSVRELERRVDGLMAGPTSTAVVPADDHAQLTAFAELLGPLCDTDVRIVAQRRGGYEIRIRCDGIEALASTVDRMRAGAQPDP